MAAVTVLGTGRKTTRAFASIGVRVRVRVRIRVRVRRQEGLRTSRRKEGALGVIGDVKCLSLTLTLTLTLTLIGLLGMEYLNR